MQRLPLHKKHVVLAPLFSPLSPLPSFTSSLSAGPFFSFSSSFGCCVFRVSHASVFLGVSCQSCTLRKITKSCSCTKETFTMLLRVVFGVNWGLPLENSASALGVWVLGTCANWELVIMVLGFLCFSLEVMRLFLLRLGKLKDYLWKLDMKNFWRLKWEFELGRWTLGNYLFRFSFGSWLQTESLKMKAAIFFQIF